MRIRIEGHVLGTTENFWCYLPADSLEVAEHTGMANFRDTARLEVLKQAGAAVIAEVWDRPSAEIEVARLTLEDEETGRFYHIALN
jgi:hypothetical protein